MIRIWPCAVSASTSDRLAFSEPLSWILCATDTPRSCKLEPSSDGAPHPAQRPVDELAEDLQPPVSLAARRAVRGRSGQDGVHRGGRRRQRLLQRLCASFHTRSSATVTASQAFRVSLRAVAHALRGWPTPLGVAVDTSDRVFDAAGALDDAVVLGRLDLLADQVVGFARATAGPQLHAVAL